MVASPAFAELLREQLAPLGPITMRRMFGKTGVFCGGVMFGVVSEDTLYLRVDDGNRAAFKEAESSPPLSYVKQGRTVNLSFWQAPERLIDEPDELVVWLRQRLGRRIGWRQNEGGRHGLEEHEGVATRIGPEYPRLQPLPRARERGACSGRRRLHRSR